MLSIIEKVIQLRTVEMLSGASDAILAEVASLLEEHEAREGDELVVKGRPSSKMFLIVTGHLTVEDGERTLAELGPREVFGELAALNPEPQTVTITARDYSLLLSLDHLPLLELMTEQIGMTAGIVRFLCRRVIKAEAGAVWSKGAAW